VVLMGSVLVCKLSVSAAVVSWIVSGSAVVAVLCEPRLVAAGACGVYGEIAAVDCCALVCGDVLLCQLDCRSKAWPIVRVPGDALFWMKTPCLLRDSAGCSAVT
jgi:hypothetical protein